jgi:hypothetical protein
MTPQQIAGRRFYGQVESAKEGSRLKAGVYGLVEAL